jgi:hypothetical protein
VVVGRGFCEDVGDDGEPLSLSFKYKEGLGGEDECKSECQVLGAACLGYAYCPVSRLPCSDGCVVYGPGLGEGLPLFDQWEGPPESRLEWKGESHNGVKLKTTVKEGNTVISTRVAVCKRKGSGIFLSFRPRHLSLQLQYFTPDFTSFKNYAFLVFFSLIFCSLP